MATQVDKAQQLAALHKKGEPVIFYNIWDAGSAKAVVAAGAKAVATGSASVAEAQGYEDGEDIPLDLVLRIAERIAGSVDVPFSLDFEGGYSTTPEGLEENIGKVIDAGVVGINFEDQVLATGGLYSIEEQAERIRAVRSAADAKGIPLWINARTDLFIQESDQEKHVGLMQAAFEREAAYREAGASSFFVPVLKKNDLIAQMCARCELPVNVIKIGGVDSVEELAKLGVARVSYGPVPYRALMADLTEKFRAL
jgi:2-methylisocitrate lyase-like PEP mutase family enzyme